MDQRLELMGWVLFLVCAPLFLVPALLGGDWWTVSASVVFGVGVVLFLVAARLRAR